jgi:3-isopropylmalate dehydrogenase
MNILVMEGDGIGPEIVRATLSVLKQADKKFGLDLTFSSVPIGLSALEKSGTTMPPESLEAARASQGTILGPISHNSYPPVSEGGLNPSGVLRKSLDLYGNIRPARTRPAFPPPCGKEFDIVIVRENTEGFYSDRSMHMGPGEIMPTPDLALSIRKISRSGSTRIVEMAFAQAHARPRKKVTCVHKGNVLRLSDGLFLECARGVAARHPDIEYEEQLVDSMAALLVRDPGRFDVVVTTNMFGDILSDQASELSGSLGLAASLNVGTKHAVAQAQHGSAPDIAGRDIANPSSLIGSAAMLMAWLGEARDAACFTTAAAAIDRALDEVISSGAARTPDLGGKHGTQAFAAAVAERLSA